MKHNFVLIPKEKIIMGGPMEIFIRCKNKGCIAGVDWSGGDPKEQLKLTKKNVKGDCPFIWKIK